jgi:phospholipid/cholesterol/gamma-HCH transport system substrate-binding protein
MVTISVNPGVRLPSDLTARVGQASLLGAKYIELSRPNGTQPESVLPPNSTLGLQRTGTYTQTEDLLASVAALLNGGGLQNVRTISTELNKALGGRTPQIRGLLGQLNTLSGGLDGQKADIVRAIDGIDRLGTQLAAQNAVIGKALDTFPPALDVLNAERDNLTTTLQSLGNFGEAANDVIDRGGDDLTQNIANLGPPLKGLADSGNALTGSLDYAASVLFPVSRFGDQFYGDYINFYVTLDLTLGTLDRNFLTGTPLAGKLGAVEKALAAGEGVSGQAKNPLLTPLSVLPGQADTPAARMPLGHGIAADAARTHAPKPTPQPKASTHRPLAPTLPIGPTVSEPSNGDGALHSLPGGN